MGDQESSSVVLDLSNGDSTDPLYAFLDEFSSTNEFKVSSVAEVPNSDKVPIFHQPIGEENQKYASEEKVYPNRNPYEELYYMQYRHISNVLERTLTGIHYELSQLNRSVYQLAYDMKECTDTMGFYTTRMLAFQKEMFRETSKANTSLQAGVHLLQEIKEQRSPYLVYTSKDLDGKSGPSDESRSKRHYRDIQPRSPEDNGLRYSKRDRK